MKKDNNKLAVVVGPLISLITTGFFYVLSLFIPYIPYTILQQVIFVVIILILLTLLCSMILNHRGFCRIINLLEEIKLPLRKEIEESSSKPKVYFNCKWIKVERQQEENLWIRCERGLMDAEGCKTGCIGFERPPKEKPKGYKTLIGTCAGSILGLAGGPLGVILCSFVGGLTGYLVEKDSLNYQLSELEEKIRSLKKEGKLPKIYLYKIN